MTAEDPAPGYIVKSRHETILQRHVVAVSACNIKYLVPAKNSGFFERNCLPLIWRKWCRAHDAKVIAKE